MLLFLTIFFPVVLIAAWTLQSTRTRLQRFTAWAPLPALLLSIFATEFTVDLPWLLFGSRLGLDTTGRVFLAFTSGLWLAAGLYATCYLAKDTARDRFDLFHLVTMLGNLGVIVSQDMGSFLLFYTVMSLAAYGLITHDRHPTSLRAGRVYIMLAILGEVLLFWAVLLTAQQTDTLYFAGLGEKLAVSPIRHVIVGLVLVGFGIKLGLMPLHFWLPLAHPAAPTPASAVLSGAIIKTGLLGMLRLLPLGAVATQDWGAVCIITGLASAFLAVFIGLTQENAKTILAYSSVSQMGLVGVMIGIAMMTPQAWPLISVAIVIYATHHAVAKASLFLGVGVAQCELPRKWQRSLVILGLVVAALSLSGLPLTSGFVAKMALKDSAAVATAPWVSNLTWVLPWTGLTTTLLIARFLYLVWPSRQQSRGRLAPALAIPWAILAVGVVLLPLGMRCVVTTDVTWFSIAPHKVWAAVWPMLMAAATIILVATIGPVRERLKAICIPAGDLVLLWTLALESCRRAWNFRALIEPSVLRLKADRLSAAISNSASELIESVACRIENDNSSGLIFGFVVAVLLGLILFSSP